MVAERHRKLTPTEQAWNRPHMRRWQCCVSLLVLLVTTGHVPNRTGAAEQVRPIRIGALTPSWGPPPQVLGLRDGLQELGYRKGEQFVIGVRFTQGNIAALFTAAQELVKLGPDLIFAHRDGAAKAAQTATATVPTGFVGVNDPRGIGLIKSFARPGGNITGVTDLELSLAPKRLEIFHEVVPGLKRVLFPYDPADAYSVAGVKVYREAARSLGIVLLEKTLRTEEEARAALNRVQKGEVDGILRPASSSLNIPGFILEAAAKQAIPTMFNGVFMVEQGALASYGPDEYETGRQAARLVDKILKGANPGEIPVEVNPKIRFAINLKVAKSLGLTIAPEVLYRADQLVR
jgi:putative tryptophan/tyrosine transport system substrate-binding protein